jgi:hypothetical protein
MSKVHKPSGISKSLGSSVQRKRAERHGKPQVMRKRTVKTDEATGKIVVVHEWVPLPDDGATRRVASGPTNNYGKKQNVVERKGK